jgi:hypothetical protein
MKCGVSLRITSQHLECSFFFSVLLFKVVYSPTYDVGVLVSHFFCTVSGCPIGAYPLPLLAHCRYGMERIRGTMEEGAVSPPTTTTI